MDLTKNKSGLLAAAPHILIWGALSALPALFIDFDSDFVLTEYVKAWLPLLFSAFIFYFNYYFLIEKLLFQKHIVWFILINIGLIILCSWSLEVTKGILSVPHKDGHWGRHRGGHNPGKRMFFFNVVPFLFTSGLSVAIRATQGWIMSETKRKNLENENLKSELTYLRYQLQPHFFFNSLNSIYSLVDSSPEKSKEAIHGLGKLMRYVLYEAAGEKTSLTKEIEFLRNYIKLMQIRLPGQVRINSSFPSVFFPYEIAPLLFIPLIENAFKHGISSTELSEITIKMEVEGNRILFETENTSFPKHKPEDVTESGIGFENLKKRLPLLYPGRFDFKAEISGKVFQTRLMIEL